MYRRDVWMIIKGFFTLVGKLFTGRLRREGLESGERLFLLLALATLPLLPAVLLESYVESLSAVSWAVGVLLLVNGAILFLSDKLSSGRESLDTAGPRKGAAGRRRADGRHLPGHLALGLHDHRRAVRRLPSGGRGALLVPVVHPRHSRRQPAQAPRPV